MKTIRLLSEIAAAAGADIEMLREFITNQCTGDDRHSQFSILEIPVSISDTAEFFLSHHAEDPQEGIDQEQLIALREQATEAMKITNYMATENIDLFHDDIVCYPTDH